MCTVEVIEEETGRVLGFYEVRSRIEPVAGTVLAQITATYGHEQEVFIGPDYIAKRAADLWIRLQHQKLVTKQKELRLEQAKNKIRRLEEELEDGPWFDEF